MNPHALAIKSKEEYLNTFGELYEHSAWIIEKSYEEVKGNDIYNNIQVFHTLLSQIVLKASKQEQVNLIKAHPMLAGEKALKKELTKFSSNEQNSAGLNTCSQEEIKTFNNLNKTYFEKFGFPFILAVKGLNKEEILNNFQKRIENSSLEEREEALKQINKIAMIRIKDIYEQQ